MALSYRWTKDASEEVFLDGRGVIRISQDLDAALRRFRHASALRWIWVDAICINQQDNAEKSIQIPLMLHIYRDASRVMIWLGNRDEDADLLRHIKLLVRDAKACAEELDSSLALGEAGAKETLITSLCLSLSQLGRLAWFTRRWILQELALNANAVLCCGQTELPWPQLATVLGHSEENNGRSRSRRQKRSLLLRLSEDSDSRRIQLLWDLWWYTTISPTQRSQYWYEPSALHKRDIAALMSAYSDFECSDGRDKIAALLGLSRDTQGPTAFRVDYGDSTEQTYVKFAGAMVRTGHMAWLLCQNFQRGRERGGRATILPSWVPDWRFAMAVPPLDSRLIYWRGPASSIKASTNIHGVHLLTTVSWKFELVLPESIDPQSKFVPVTDSAPFFEILWKSSPFPEETSLKERVALVMVDLWPRIVARLAEDAKTSRKMIWYRLLLQVMLTLTCGISRPARLFDRFESYPTFGEEDVNDPEEVRRYVTYLLQDHLCLYQSQERDNSMVLANCLIFCQQASDCPNTYSICGMGYVPAPFYDQVVVGDKVLWAQLGAFGIDEYVDEAEDLQWSRYIVREQALAPEGFIDSAADRLENMAQPSSHRINNPGSNSKLVSPWVYEFVAPCQAFNPFSLFPWADLRFTTWLPSDSELSLEVCLWIR